MAEIAGLLAAGVLNVAAGKMAEAAGDRVLLQRRFGEDLEDMEDTVESIQAVLEDAERQSIQNASVRLWLKRLTRASNHISDMFDEFEVDKTRKSSLRKLQVLNPCLKLAPEVGMASKMQKIREKLENISNHHHKFSFVASNSSNVQQVNDERATSSEVIEANILGRDEAKKEVTDLLKSVSALSEFIILPIYGMGGMGKTTLAQLLFNDTHFNDYRKAWVYVGQTFDLSKIKDSVNSQVPQEQDAGSSASNKILIVLDDLWEEDESKLTRLKHSLRMVGNGCKQVHAIVTTRNASIADKIKTNEACQIKPLSRDMCWAIIKQIVGFENRTYKERFQETGMSIADKCEGVALAAITIGHLLKSRDFNGWNSIKESGIWSASMSGSSPYDNVLASLKLSYSNMPACLRLCFAYCAIFPKGHKMAKDDLIYQWTSLGFINSPDDGENYIKQLLGMSFFQDSFSPSSQKKQHSFSPLIDVEYCKDPVQLFTMHDLVHDLARLIMGDELLDPSTKCNNTRGRNYRYALIADCSNPPHNSFVTYPDNIRALCFLGSGEAGHYHAGFAAVKYLRVLDLAECSLEKLPSSIGKLKLLRYLNAPGIKDQVIPSSITKLSKLVFLRLHGSRELLALPESIGEMEALMYLDLSGCKQLDKLPKSFGKLGNLVHLDISDCHFNLVHLEIWPRLERRNFIEILQEFHRKQFNSCRNREEILHSKRGSGLPESLCTLTKLQYLNLSQQGLINMLGQYSIRRLSEVIQKLTELRYLNVSGCLEIQPEDLDRFLYSVSNLSNLEHLNLSNNDIIKTIPDCICNLSKLHTLNLAYSRELVKLPGNMRHMDNLKFLIVNHCERLDRSTLPTNKSLIILCANFDVHTAEGEQSSNLTLLKDANSTPELNIRCLENVKSIQEAQRIGLNGKQIMVELGLHWTEGSKGYVEDMELLRALIPPRSLKRFSLEGYKSVLLPSWLLTVDIYLPNLEIVTLRGLTKCSCLPPLGQLPQLKHLELNSMPNITRIDRSFCGNAEQAFTRLQVVEISNMENLEEWTTAYSNDEGVAEEFMFPNLQYLSIVGCGKLTVSPRPPKVREWHIQDSDTVLVRWGEVVPHTWSAPPLVAKLHVIRSMAPFDQWKLLNHLIGLNELCINNGPDLRSSPEITPSALVSIRSLWFYSVEELPQWLQNCVSLERLNLIQCPYITSFPESIKRLRCLQYLKLYKCPMLRKWCELEENLATIHHIREKCFDN